MAALGLALVIAVAGVGTLVWLWRTDRGGGLFILAALPFALLFPAAGTAAAAWTLIEGFRGIARSGSGGLRSVAAFSADSTRVELLGVVACAMVVIIAAILQRLAALSADPDDASTPPSAGRAETGAWWLWVFAGWPLLVLATAGLAVRVRDLPVIVVKLAQAMGDGRTPVQADVVAGVATRLRTEANVGASSSALSNELVLATLLSLALGGFLVVVGIIGIVAFTTTSKPRWIGAWSWIRARRGPRRRRCLGRRARQRPALARTDRRLIVRLSDV